MKRRGRQDSSRLSTWAGRRTVTATTLAVDSPTTRNPPSYRKGPLPWTEWRLKARTTAPTRPTSPSRRSDRAGVRSRSGEPGLRPGSRGQPSSTAGAGGTDPSAIDRHQHGQQGADHDGLGPGVGAVVETVDGRSRSGARTRTGRQRRRPGPPPPNRAPEHRSAATRTARRAATPDRTAPPPRGTRCAAAARAPRNGRSSSGRKRCSASWPRRPGWKGHRCAAARAGCRRRPTAPTRIRPRGAETAPAAAGGPGGPRTGAARSWPVRRYSPSRSDVTRKPDRTKKMSTPSSPPLAHPSPAWNAMTARTATPRRPSRPGTTPIRSWSAGAAAPCSSITALGPALVSDSPCPARATAMAWARRLDRPFMIPRPMRVCRSPGGRSVRLQLGTAR